MYCMHDCEGEEEESKRKYDGKFLCAIILLSLN